MVWLACMCKWKRSVLTLTVEKNLSTKRKHLPRLTAEHWPPGFIVLWVRSDNRSYDLRCEWHYCRIGRTQRLTAKDLYGQFSWFLYVRLAITTSLIFLDQCYSGDQTVKTFDRFGTSNSCITGGFDICTPQNKYCIGQCSSIYVYKFNGMTWQSIRSITILANNITITCYPICFSFSTESWLGCKRDVGCSVQK